MEETIIEIEKITKEKIVKNNYYKVLLPNEILQNIEKHKEIINILLKNGIKAENIEEIQDINTRKTYLLFK